MNSDDLMTVILRPHNTMTLHLILLLIFYLPGEKNLYACAVLYLIMRFHDFP